MGFGKFVISLDLELHWGVLARLTPEEYEMNLRGTRESISKTLELFDKFKISATWATVGFLFFNSKEELLRNIPSKLPSYKDNKFNAYRIISDIGDNELQDPYHFGKSIIKQISSYPSQEIATHTFSHYFCLEEGQTVDQFNEDLTRAVAVAEKSGFHMKSIVFPRNQYSSEYLQTCKKNGITVFRSNPQHKIYRPQSNTQEKLSTRFLRLLDAYFNISGDNTATPSYKDGIHDIPASRFLRPYNKKFSVFEKKRIKRIKSGMEAAAKKDKIYHLWWHPHNFGKDIDLNLAVLEDLLGYYSELNAKYGFESLSMKRLSEMQN